MSYIEVRGISKSFPVGKDHKSRQSDVSERLKVLEDITFSVERGSFHCLLGASGCGKSTLLRIIDGLIQPDNGEVRIDNDSGNEVVQRPTPRLSMTFQQFNLLPWRTALGNVEFGLELLKMPKAIRRDKAVYYLEMTGLHGFERYFPAQLSGGMQQRVALARALAVEPHILLMDEPFSALDALTRSTLQVEFLELRVRQNLTVLFVTHDIDEAVFLADRVHVMGSRPGRIMTSIDVDLPPERNDDVRNTTAFAAIRGRVAAALKQYIVPMQKINR